ncbi:HDOD domain-containing protein [Congregibacter sp.]|uniref:HDOD domain-containing protein n=1 Tax=Congregibacter sp. TaxID=2744308 RepID=UPI003F6A6759
MTGATLSNWSRKATALPVLPVVVTTLLSLDPNDDNAFSELLKLAKVDPGLTVEILRILRVKSRNSVTISSLKKALIRIGAASLKELVTRRSSVQVFVPTAHAETCMWLHFIQVAIASEQLSRSFRSLEISRNRAYLAGLLHDMGRLVDFERLAKSPSEVDRVGYKDPSSLLLAEAQAFGHNHVQLGSIAGNAWSLPDYIIGAIEHHHSDLRAVSIREENLKIIEVVKFADEISMHAMRSRGDDPHTFQRLCQAFFEKQSVYLHKLSPPQEVLDGILTTMIDAAEKEFTHLQLGKAPINCMSTIPK